MQRLLDYEDSLGENARVLKKAEDDEDAAKKKEEKK
jgi:hypothetical protein